MTAGTHSLEESAGIILGTDDGGNPLPGKTDWLVRRLRRGELPGYKAGRQWRMTDDDIAVAIDRMRPKSALPELPSASGLTPTSRRRLRAS
jgi:hypothetical protein